MNQSKSTRAVPAAYLLMQAVPQQLAVEGHYDSTTQTWSNREYEAASEKKHQEQK